MSYSDFTKLYGTTAKAKFWCDYMTGLKGQLQVITLLSNWSVEIMKASDWLMLGSGHAPAPSQPLRVVPSRH